MDGNSRLHHNGSEVVERHEREVCSHRKKHKRDYIHHEPGQIVDGLEVAVLHERIRGVSSAPGGFWESWIDS